MKLTNTLLVCAIFAGVAAPILAQDPPPAPPPAVPEAWTQPNATYRSSIPADRPRAFFGELHLHTTLSLDAWTYGTKVTPDMAYKFGRGETVMVPAIQAAREEGVSATGAVPAKRAWPLDFMAVTDHSEYMGAMHQLDDPASAFANSDAGKKVLAWSNDPNRVGNVGKILKPMGPEARQSILDAFTAANSWAVIMKAAADNYQPGRFTTFVAYEWSAVRGGTMHRNVIFNADHAPTPFTSQDSNKPEDLWKYLESVRARGIDVIAIPHNSNRSNGHDFDWNMSDGKPINEAYAQERALNEPLVEISQHKGTSETTPELSPTDEFADFELLSSIDPVQHGSYVREAFGRGLIIQGKVGVNPFKMGIVGASDFHNGLSASDESAYAGSGPFGIDPNSMTPSPAVAEIALSTTRDKGGRSAEARRQRRNDVDDNADASHHPVTFSGAAITGVWAEENTRSSIFAALKRKETFGTSGTRIRLRMFGGWAFDPKLLRKSDWVKDAYAKGVPMGSDLPAKPSKASAPRFVLQAMRDPDGANLDRIQIIKVWLDGDSYKEKLFDVALSDRRKDDSSGHAPPVGNTVDLTTGVFRNTIGSATLTAVWRDPEFDPKTPAVYYARALEIPTPRWSTLLAVRNKLPIPTGVPSTIQERAWSSPIWFTPAKS